MNALRPIIGSLKGTRPTWVSVLTALLLAQSSLTWTTLVNGQPNASPNGQPVATPSAATGPVPTASPPATASPASPATPAAAPTADPHGMGGAPSALLSGSPYASPAHVHQAELLRAGRLKTNQTQNMPGEGIPAGTIGMLVRNEQGGPLVGTKVKLLITHESISDGNKDTTKEATTDDQGRAGFTGLNTDSSYKYEAVVEQDGARYSTGAMRLRRESGHIAVLYVYPTTHNLEDTFVVTRMLYALQPREDIFQVDTILRIQNGGTKTWSPKNFYLQLPEDSQAFRPPKAEGDIRAVAENHRVHITGSFTPGQHELSFGFQVPNPRTPDIRLNLQTVPHLTDARVFLEATDTMALQVDGLRPAEKTRGQEGQQALMASADFLGNGSAGPASLNAVITGMPPRSKGNIFATVLAGLVAMLGVAFAIARPDKATTVLTDDDRARAKALLLDELVSLEKAYRAKEVGPKTYEQARRTLLDSMARLGT